MGGRLEGWPLAPPQPAAILRPLRTSGRAHPSTGSGARSSMRAAGSAPICTISRHRSLLDPLGAVGPFNRMVGPNQAFSIVWRPGAHRDVARQFTLGKLIAVNLKLELGAGLGNRRGLALPFARIRLGLAPVGAAEIGGTRLSLR